MFSYAIVPGCYLSHKWHRVNIFLLSKLFQNITSPILEIQHLNALMDDIRNMNLDLKMRIYSKNMQYLLTFNPIPEEFQSS